MKFPIYFVVLSAVFPMNFLLKCKPEKSMKILDCQGLGLTEVPVLPQVVANQILKMNLSSNSIQVLHEDNFKHYISLVELIIDDNRLQKITEHALDALTKLKFLSLRNNILVIQPDCLSRKAFRSLDKLIRLDLSENPLGIIKQDFFRPLRNLEELYLEKAVKGLIVEKGAFFGLNSLSLLSLAHNDFETLPEYLSEDFTSMSVLSQLGLHGNRWICDCHLRWLKNVIERVQKRNSNNDYTKQARPRCSGPAPQREMELQMLKDNDYQCRPRLFTQGYTIRASQNANISLVCEIYTNPVSRVNWYKDGVAVQTTWHGIKMWNSGTYDNNATLFIEKAENGFDDGQYRCETGNSLGRVSTNFTVKIMPYYTSKRVHLKQILILIGIGASILIVLIGIIGVVMYLFLGTKHRCLPENDYSPPEIQPNRYRNRAPKPITVDNSESLENYHFLDSSREPGTVTQQSGIRDANSMISSTILGVSSEEEKNVHFFNQLLTSYVPQCPIHVVSSTDTEADSMGNTCPLHGTTPILSKQCLMKCAPLLICTNSPQKPQSPNIAHYSHIDSLNTNNELRNSLLGNVEAFYSLERQMKLPNSNHFPSGNFRNQPMTSSFTNNPN